MPSQAWEDPNHPTPTQDDLWEHDRALLEEHGPSHVESICAVAAGLRAEGEEAEAAELDRQCARMGIILMNDGELLSLYQRTEGGAGGELADLLRYEIEWRGLDT
jgi:hypothetical protein